MYGICVTCVYTKKQCVPAELRYFNHHVTPATYSPRQGIPEKGIPRGIPHSCQKQKKRHNKEGLQPPPTLYYPRTNFNALRSFRTSDIY